MNRVIAVVGVSWREKGSSSRPCWPSSHSPPSACGRYHQCRGLKGFAWWLIPLIAFFGFMNDMIKFMRWDIYLKKLGIVLTIKQSLIVFVSGLSMSATPGKVGLLIKPNAGWLVRTVFHLFHPGHSGELYMDLLV